MIIHWTDKMDALLGTNLDHILAKQLDISQSAIFHRRIELRIPAYRNIHQKKVWTEDEMDMIGKFPDKIVGKFIGADTSTVRSVRVDFGVSCCWGRKSGKIDWTDSELVLLGTNSDYIVGKLIGVSITAVRLKRKELGIPSHRSMIKSSPSIYPQEFNEIFKQMIRNRDRNVCRICYLPDQTGCALSVHHIDYDKENTMPDNCCALCVSCHAVTNFNRSYWQAKLQESMRARNV